MLQIIWGEDWQANRAALLAALCQSGDGQRIWIVPEQASFAAEQQLCRKGGSGICRHAQVLSFTRLANRVFAASGGVARQTLDQGGRVLAMAQALEQVRSRLKRYAAGSRRAALLPELLAAVDEWKSYGVTASDLRRAAGQTEGLLAGKQVSWLPSYGPEMRGGTANCNVILSDTPVGSPIVQHPNVLMVMNNPSLDKYEDTVAPGGKIFVDSTLIGRKVRRTDVEAYYIPATGLAGEMGVPTLANMLLLGALVEMPE